MARAYGSLSIADSRLTPMEGFGSNPGHLSAWVHVPDLLPPQSPLVVVLHGCGQTAAGYDHGTGWSTLADRHRFALLFPEQTFSNNVNRCFNWFKPADIARDGGELASIRQMIDAVVKRERIDPKRIFVTGLSAGGAMASALLAVYPEVFAGGAILAGLPYGTAQTVPQALQRMRGQGLPPAQTLASMVQAASPHTGSWPRISIWQGSADETVHPDNAQAILDQWRLVHRLAPEPSRTERVMGHQRRVWSDAAGKELIEAYTIEGMGHGVALDTSVSDSDEHAGPYMLDAHLSATRQIAGFWRILTPATRQSGAAKPPPGQGRADTRGARRPRDSSMGPLFAMARKTIAGAIRALRRDR